MIQRRVLADLRIGLVEVTKILLRSPIPTLSRKNSAKP